ncbi:MAG TPA: sn-glycerol-3-phosphate ABC transporter ATP-binding protein UgpC [Casimicrobiaceae bacterium]|nr:sn-glycerol-3-phosphate ABC transporter ATP-binding protein UgpC [Casimicrobiaceae bacterium]
MAQISLRGVAKHYGEVAALTECTLDIQDREFVVLVGPSGSGKTTLLRIIAGLEYVSAGEVWFGDRCVNDVDVADRDIAMVFQNYGLYPHMSVYDNMAFGLRRRRLSPNKIDEHVRRTARLLSIEPLLSRRPRQLSGGQRQRVALGRAIVRDPAVFLLDEPLSNLDAHLRVQMRGEILKVHRAVTATTIYVTHDQVEALTMGDRIVVMNQGRIHQVGTPADLYDVPIDKFVASFIGTPAMGFIACRIERSSQGVELVTDSARMRLSPAKAQAVAKTTAERVFVGIRPERLTLAPEERASTAEVMVRGIVELVEMIGAEQYVHVATESGSLTARVPREQAVKAEKTVTLTAAARDLHLFDQGTGIALR